MDLRRLLFLFAFLLLTAASPAGWAAGAQDTPRKQVTGLVRDADRKPLAGVEYWASGFHTAHGEIYYTGVPHVRKTDDWGAFKVEYGGAGRPETRVSVSFQHPDFAPAWLIRAAEKDSPVTVRLEKGVALQGMVESENATELSQNGQKGLWQWPLEVWLDVCHREAGGSTRLESKTDHQGQFTFQIPTNYRDCGYSLLFAGGKKELNLPESDRLPRITVRVGFSVTLEPAPSGTAIDQK